MRFIKLFPLRTRTSALNRVNARTRHVCYFWIIPYRQASQQIFRKGSGAGRQFFGHFNHRHVTAAGIGDSTLLTIHAPHLALQIILGHSIRVKLSTRPRAEEHLKHCVMCRDTQAAIITSKTNERKSAAMLLRTPYERTIATTARPPRSGNDR